MRHHCLRVGTEGGDAVAGARADPPIVRAEGRRDDRVLAAEIDEVLPGRGVPERHQRVEPGDGDAASVGAWIDARSVPRWIRALT